MDLSIIVPVHNLENYLQPLLTSLRVQVFYYEVQLIFVCDNCTDKTYEILDAWKTYYEQQKPPKVNNYQIEIYSVDVRSCGLARNEGMEHAKGEYIWFIDGDDWIVDTWAITKIISLMKINEHEFLRFKYEAPGFHDLEYYSMVWQYCFKYDAIKDIKFLDVQPGEDNIFMDELAKRGYKYISLKEVIYHYNYMREGSNVHQMVKKGKIE